MFSPSFYLLYRKVLKSSEIVYNGFEIKNGMTKERRVYFAMTLSVKFFVLLSALSDGIEKYVAYGFIHIP